MRDRKREIVRENAKEPHNEERVSGKAYMIAISTPFPPRMNISTLEAHHFASVQMQACKRTLQMHSSLEVFISGCLVSEISRNRVRTITYEKRRRPENLIIPQRNT
jgi:hypothetical protein